MHDPIWHKALTLLFHIQQHPATPRWAMHAETFAWESDPITALIHGAEAMPDTTPLLNAALPAPCGLWYFGSIIRSAHERESLGGFLYRITSRGEIEFTPLIRNAEGTTATSGQQWSVPLDGTVADVSCHDDLRNSSILFTKLFARGCVWLHERVWICCTASHVERHARKRLAKRFKTDVPRTVQVIQLRRVDYAPHETTPRGAIEYQCQWVVRNHDRKWKFKDGREETIPVKGHIRGPKDKPLRMPSHTVYAVTR